MTSGNPPFLLLNSFRFLVLIRIFQSPMLFMVGTYLGGSIYIKSSYYLTLTFPCEQNMINSIFFRWQQEISLKETKDIKKNNEKSEKV